MRRNATVTLQKAQGVEALEAHGFEFFAECGDGRACQLVGGLFGNSQRSSYFAVAFAVTDSFRHKAETGRKSVHRQFKAGRVGESFLGGQFDFGVGQAGDVAELPGDLCRKGKEFIYVPLHGEGRLSSDWKAGKPTLIGGEDDGEMGLIGRIIFECPGDGAHGAGFRAVHCPLGQMAVLR
jgi:hypothetical protein